MSRLKKPLWMLRMLGKQRDNAVFHRAHDGEGDALGMQALYAHKRVTEALTKMGYDITDERVKAIASLAVRAALDEDWAAALQKETPDGLGAQSPEHVGVFTPLYSTELEIPERRRL